MTGFQLSAFNVATVDKVSFVTTWGSFVGIGPLCECVAIFCDDIGLFCGYRAFMRVCSDLLRSTLVSI